MNLKEARALEQGDEVVDTEGISYAFIALDKEKDILVECRSAVKGWITLLRVLCSVGPKHE